MYGLYMFKKFEVLRKMFIFKNIHVQTFVVARKMFMFKTF